MISQAPRANLAIAKTIVTIAGRDRSRTPLIAALRRQSGPRSRSQWRTMPACDRVIEVKTPIAYSGISASTVPPKATRIAIARKARATMPGAERQPLAAEREAAGHEPVAGEDRGEPREVGEARVRGQDQDPGRRELEQVVERPGPERRPGDLRHDRLVVGRRHGPDDAGQDRDPQEHDRHEGAHHRERQPGVGGLGALEGRHAVRDGLDAGDRAAAVGERAHHEQDAQRLEGHARRHDPGHVRARRRSGPG